MADRLAAFDYAGLGKMLRPRLEKDGRGWRACAVEIGVTAPDLSRVVSGQAVSAPKVFAICDWLGIPDRRFYRPGFAAKCFTGKALKQEPEVLEKLALTVAEKMGDYNFLHGLRAGIRAGRLIPSRLSDGRVGVAFDSPEARSQ